MPNTLAQLAQLAQSLIVRLTMSGTTVVPTTTTATIGSDENVDLAMSILTILTTLCQASGPRKRESPECVQAQRDLLALVSLDRTPWIVRGSESAKRTSLEEGLLAFMEKSSKDARDFSLDRSSRHEVDGFPWGSFFRGLQGLLAAGSKIKDHLHFVSEIKDYLMKDPGADMDKLKVFLDFHQTGQLDSVLQAIHSAELKSIYIIVGLVIFLTITTSSWLALNLKTYYEQRKVRRAQKSARQAGILLRGMQDARRGQLMDIEATRALV